MNLNLVAQQYSPTVALAQDSAALDDIALKLLTAIGHFELPEPLAGTGLQFHHVQDRKTMEAAAHGKQAYSVFDHVWLEDGCEHPRLCGRIQFWERAKDPKEDSLIYRVLFDALGNVRLGADKYFSMSINPNDMPVTLRQLALGLINAIHKTLETVAREA